MPIPRYGANGATSRRREGAVTLRPPRGQITKGMPFIAANHAQTHEPRFSTAFCPAVGLGSPAPTAAGVEAAAPLSGGWQARQPQL